jgi:hypothetical protein
MQDIRDEIITHQTAERLYKVVYDHKTLEVYHEKTLALRQRARQTRLENGKRYQDFIEEWSGKRPSAEILEEYGAWPDAAKVKEIIRL